MIDNTLILTVTDIIQLPEAERLQAIHANFGDRTQEELFDILFDVLNAAVDYSKACDETIWLHLVCDGQLDPHAVEKLNVPSFHAALNGVILSKKAPNQKALCETCAYRCGTLANSSLSTQSDAAHAIETDRVFYCHKDIENLHSPSATDRKRMKPCKGWAQHVKKHKGVAA